MEYAAFSCALASGALAAPAISRIELTAAVFFSHRSMDSLLRLHFRRRRGGDCHDLVGWMYLAKWQKLSGLKHRGEEENTPRQEQTDHGLNLRDTETRA